MIYLLLGCLLVIVSLLGRLFYLSKKLRQLPTNPSQTLVKHDPFLLHLSHQLRTALNGIVGTSTLLDNGSLSADQREKILIIRRSTISLMHIVDQLHDHLSGKDHTQTPKTSGQVTHDQTAISQFSARILLAEDNKMNQLVINKILQKLGCTVDVADHGQIALGLYQQFPYDLVLMDCEMPELNGYATAQAIRSFERERKVAACPIIALTAHVIGNTKEECLKAGMNNYLAKPITLEGLQEVLKLYLKPVE